MKATSKDNISGFTLLEVMLGLTITAMVMVILLAALRLGHRSQEKGMARVEVAQRMRIVSDRLSWMISGAYPYRYQDSDDQKKQYLLFRGSSSSLEFVTTSTDAFSNTPADIAGLKFVRLSVGASGLMAQEKVFFMGVDYDVFEEDEEFIFGPRISSMEFEYMDMDEDTDTIEWSAGWDTEEKNYLPSVVRITLTLKHGDKILDIPPVIASIRTGGVHGLLIPKDIKKDLNMKQKWVQ
jgi:general secretion pathway protein J